MLCGEHNVEMIHGLLARVSFSLVCRMDIIIAGGKFFLLRMRIVRLACGGREDVVMMPAGHKVVSSLFT